MSNQTVLLIRDSGVGWAAVETTLQSMPEVARVHAASTVDEAEQLAARDVPDLVVTALELQGESTIPLISHSRHTLQITAPIFVITQPLNCTERPEVAFVGDHDPRTARNLGVCDRFYSDYLGVGTCPPV